MPLRSCASQPTSTGDEWQYLSVAFEEFRNKIEGDEHEITRQRNAALAQVSDKLDRITNAYLDGSIEREIYDRRKAGLLAERTELQNADQSPCGAPVIEQVSKFLELAKTAYSLYETAELSEKRQLLLNVTSNRILNGKNIEFTLETPFRLIAERGKLNCGAAPQDIHRTVEKFLHSLFTVAVRTETLATKRLTR